MGPTLSIGQFFFFKKKKNLKMEFTHRFSMAMATLDRRKEEIAAGSVPLESQKAA